MATRRPAIPQDQWPPYTPPLPCLVPCPGGCGAVVLVQSWKMDAQRFVPLGEPRSPLDGTVHHCYT